MELNKFTVSRAMIWTPNRSNYLKTIKDALLIEEEEREIKSHKKASNRRRKPPKVTRFQKGISLDLVVDYLKNGFVFVLPTKEGKIYYPDNHKFISAKLNDQNSIQLSKNPDIILDSLEYIGNDKLEQKIVYTHKKNTLEVIMFKSREVLETDCSFLWKFRDGTYRYLTIFGLDKNVSLYIELKKKDISYTVRYERDTANNFNLHLTEIIRGDESELSGEDARSYFRRRVAQEELPLNLSEVQIGHLVRAVFNSIYSINGIPNPIELVGVIRDFRN